VDGPKLSKSNRRRVAFLFRKHESPTGHKMSNPSGFIHENKRRFGSVADKRSREPRRTRRGISTARTRLHAVRVRSLVLIFAAIVSRRTRVHGNDCERDFFVRPRREKNRFRRTRHTTTVNRRRRRAKAGNPHTTTGRSQFDRRLGLNLAFIWFLVFTFSAKRCVVFLFCL